MQFTDLKIIEPILRSLSEEGYTNPTPIQAQAIPHLIEGHDLLGCAQTGTGKTAAFSIPILQHIHNTKAPGKPVLRSLILTPTRELAIQIKESLDSYGRHTKVRHAVIFGGVNQNPQVATLRQGVDILVATPGRLLDLMNQGALNLRSVEMFVLDEADRMLDMGFIHDVKRVIAALPKKRQSLFFSATMPPEIVKLANTILTEPKKVEVTPVSSTAETIEQHLFYVEKGDKNDLLLHLLKKPEMSSVLVFTRTKHGADKVVKVLQKNNVKALAIHGNKSQNARQNALNSFKDKTIRVLVATDIASRGIDVNLLEYVINYEIPNIPETYVHRIGRSGRAGANGVAYSFCEMEERDYLRDIERLIKTKVPVVEEHPYVSPIPLTQRDFQRPAASQNKSRGGQSRGGSPRSGKPRQGEKSHQPNTGGAAPKKKFFKRGPKKSN
jgi:ATP-dependent RNA helicase RhlE